MTASGALDNNWKKIKYKEKTNKIFFLTFPACFSIQIFFSNLNFNSFDLLDMRNLQEQVKKAFCNTKNCSDLSLFESIVVVISNSQP